MPSQEIAYGTHEGNLDTLQGSLSCPWAIEPARSSEIELIPNLNLIKKIKLGRTLDKLIYEAFATIFMSEILKQYSDILRPNDFTLYSPEAVGFTYSSADGESYTDWTSALYQFFCPGVPLNKIENKKEKKFDIDGWKWKVRIGSRIAYLAGVLSEIFVNEGISHGDPQLRHIFMIPEHAELRYLDDKGSQIKVMSRNGLGVIDLEHCTLTGPYSSECLKDREILMEKLFEWFNYKSAQGFFENGRKVVKSRIGEYKASDLAYHMAMRKFAERFDDIVERIDMENRAVYHK